LCLQARVPATENQTAAFTMFAKLSRLPREIWLSGVLLSGLSALSCIGGLAEFGGAFSGWLDLANVFAPEFLVVGCMIAILIAIMRLPVQLKAVLCVLTSIGIVSAAARIGRDIVWSASDIPKAEGHTFKVLTFNVWNRNIAPAMTAEQILRTDADLVGLVEDKGNLRPELPRLSETYPYEAECDQDRMDGCIIYSKKPILAHGTLARAPYGVAMLWVRIIAPDRKPMTICLVHLAHPTPPRPQALQRDAVVQMLSELPKNETILMGDFNSTPWSFAMQRLDHDLKPLTRRTHSIYTWPAHLLGINVQIPFPLLPIDHIYASPNMATQAVERLARSGSDHYGVLAIFSLRP
jgi:endonuclease/exonuclease/phosphatase (EEP) superfamily protein YafD